MRVSSICKYLSTNFHWLGDLDHGFHGASADLHTGEQSRGLRASYTPAPYSNTVTVHMSPLQVNATPPSRLA